MSRVNSTIRRFSAIVRRTRVPDSMPETGGSMTRIAQAENVNASHVFQWRRAYRSDGLHVRGERSLLPLGFRTKKRSAPRIQCLQRLERRTRQPPGDDLYRVSWQGAASSAGSAWRWFVRLS